jgi:hypothetical protein
MEYVPWVNKSQNPATINLDLNLPLLGTEDPAGLSDPAITNACPISTPVIT